MARRRGKPCHRRRRSTLVVMDRIVAIHGSYFNLAASKEGFIPGSGPLRLPRLVGIQLARQGIFFERKFMADMPEGQMICDERVAYEEMHRRQHDSDGARRASPAR